VSDRPTYSAEEVDAAVAALTDPDRFTHATEIVTHAAPALGRVLDDALVSGGFFGTAHDDEVGKASRVADPHEREQAVHALLSEETKLGMLVGVAVGLELAQELARRRHGEDPA
jgi:hypothetical protein